jgi:hypothetical protein
MWPTLVNDCNHHSQNMYLLGGYIYNYIYNYIYILNYNVFLDIHTYGKHMVSIRRQAPFTTEKITPGRWKLVVRTRSDFTSKAGEVCWPWSVRNLSLSQVQKIIQKKVYLYNVHRSQSGAPWIAKLVYNFYNYSLWYILITINWVYDGFWYQPIMGILAHNSMLMEWWPSPKMAIDYLIQFLNMGRMDLWCW